MYSLHVVRNSIPWPQVVDGDQRAPRGEGSVPPDPVVRGRDNPAQGARVGSHHQEHVEAGAAAAAAVRAGQRVDEAVMREGPGRRLYMVKLSWRGEKVNYRSIHLHLC